MPKCDECDKEAVWNYQKDWLKYSEYALAEGISVPEEDFDGCDIEEPTGENNLHLCKDHAELFEETGYPY